VDHVEQLKSAGIKADDTVQIWNRRSSEWRQQLVAAVEFPLHAGLENRQLLALEMVMPDRAKQEREVAKLDALGDMPRMSVVGISVGNAAPFGTPTVAALDLHPRPMARPQLVQQGHPTGSFGAGPYMAASYASPIGHHAGLPLGQAVHAKAPGPSLIQPGTTSLSPEPRGIAFPPTYVLDSLYVALAVWTASGEKDMRERFYTIFPPGDRFSHSVVSSFRKNISDALKAGILERYLEGGRYLTKSKVPVSYSKLVEELTSLRKARKLRTYGVALFLAVSN
jgi:hypothetical protein